jgi:hypothetical protein
LLAVRVTICDAALKAKVAFVIGAGAGDVVAEALKPRGRVVAEARGRTRHALLLAPPVPVIAEDAEGKAAILLHRPARRPHRTRR